MTNVPAGARLLLDFIGPIEAPQGYETIYGNNHHLLAKPLTRMTLDEVEAAQPSWTRRFGSSAAGRYQFMRNTLDKPGTLKDIEGEMGLTGKELMSPELQDAMGYHLLKRRGYEAFVAARLSAVAFAKRLAQEWASLPVLADTKGAKRQVKRGQSYYAGDGVNRALVSPERVEAVLEQVIEAVAAERPGNMQADVQAADAFSQEVWDVQERLRALGYHEVGTVDGKFGRNTRTAILAFRDDNGLPLTPAIDDTLKAALPGAAPRQVAAERAELPPREVRERAPEVRASWWSKITALAGMLGSILLAIFKFGIDNLGDLRVQIQPVTDALGDVPAWAYLLLLAGAAGFAWWKSRESERQGMAAVRSGERR